MLTIPVMSFTSISPSLFTSAVSILNEDWNSRDVIDVHLAVTVGVA